MARQLSPVELVQNPAFGSLVLWQFTKGFQDEVVSRQPNLELLFLVFPLVLHSKSLAHIATTQVGSGLGRLAAKLSDNREDLLAVHERARSMRRLTLQSIGTALSTKIMSLSYETGNVRANEVKVPRPTEGTKQHFAGAEKLGRWIARVPASQAFSLLQVYP